MKVIWDRIHSWLREHAPTILESLNPGASAEQVSAAEEALGVTFPADVRETYRLHDGQGPWASGYPPAFLYGWEWLSLERVVEDWNVWKGLLDEGQFGGWTVEAAAGVREVWWHPGWVPLTDGPGGDHHCLDLAPAAGGKVGQVISMWHDYEDRSRLAWSFAEWLGAFADQLEEGRWGVNEYGLEEE
jgi:cell wall assembly regulator SMI1